MRPTRIRDSTMNNYDLSTITSDNLLLLLKTAKNEMLRFIPCRDAVVECEKRIEANKSVINDKKIYGCGFVLLLLIGVAIFLYITFDNPIILGIVGIVTLLTIILNAMGVNKAKRELLEDEAKLLNLKKKEDDAINEFKALLFIPNKYCSIDALTKMLEYLEDKEASNWERVTDLYKDYQYKQEMKGIALQTLEQSIIQTELVNETRNAARWAAAGSWASAAGIWRLNSKL